MKKPAVMNIRPADNREGSHLTGSVAALFDIEAASLQGLKPIRFACIRLGCNKAKVLQIADKDRSFPLFKIGGEGAHWRIDPEALELWIDAQRRKPIEAFRESVRGRGGVFTVPVDKVEDATHNLRTIAFTGIEPADGWDRASDLQNPLPDDIAVAFNVPIGSPWSAAVRKATILIALDVREQAFALKYIQERLNAYNLDPLGDKS